MARNDDVGFFPDRATMHDYPFLSHSTYVPGVAPTTVFRPAVAYFDKTHFFQCNVLADGNCAFYVVMLYCEIVFRKPLLEVSTFRRSIREFFSTFYQQGNQEIFRKHGIHDIDINKTLRQIYNMYLPDTNQYYDHAGINHEIGYCLGVDEWATDNIIHLMGSQFGIKKIAIFTRSHVTILETGNSHRVVVDIYNPQRSYRFQSVINPDIDGNYRNTLYMVHHNDHFNWLVPRKLLEGVSNISLGVWLKRRGCQTSRSLQDDSSSEDKDDSEDRKPAAKGSSEDEDIDDRKPAVKVKASSGDDDADVKPTLEAAIAAMKAILLNANAAPTLSTILSNDAALNGMSTLQLSELSVQLSQFACTEFWMTAVPRLDWSEVQELANLGAFVYGWTAAQARSNEESNAAQLIDANADQLIDDESKAGSNAGATSSCSQSHVPDCCICMLRPAVIACIPCGHIVICVDCYTHFPQALTLIEYQCPICRYTIDRLLRIYR
jgi:hypothetical protein